MKNQAAKILFGLVIFLFSVALAYFTANYMSTNAIFDYWGTVALFSCVYVVIGIAIVVIFPISLGFLFAADILILHLLVNYYGAWADVLKLITVGAVLIVLYIASAVWLDDKEAASSETPSSSPQTPVAGS
jgi:hypothetical protein